MAMLVYQRVIDKSLNKMSVSENGVYSSVMAISDWENDD